MVAATARGRLRQVLERGTVSLAGDAITRLTVPLIAIVVLEATPLEVGLLGGAQFLPGLSR